MPRWSVTLAETKPAILILDEALAALDRDIRSVVLQNLGALDVTVIIITHQEALPGDWRHLALMKGGGNIKVQKEDKKEALAWEPAKQYRPLIKHQPK